jgi:NAD(P)-dependent dehydrogenase (short-subunit alcohol dehydrogenase family)
VSSFSGKTVLITGAARGLGRDYAHFFAKDGANVVVVDIDGAGAEETAKAIAAEHGIESIGLGVDVRSEEATLAMAAAAAEAFGTVDILVNNAGIWGDYEIGGCTYVDMDYWRMVLDVNLTGALLCARAVLPGMQEQEYGRIVNVSSIGAYMPMSGAYGVSKIALNGLTFQLAHENGFANITVNSLAPGTIKNEATLKQIPEEMADVLIDQQNAVKRAGTSEDMYAALKYLCSEESGWITAQWISPNGGALSRI